MADEKKSETVGTLKASDARKLVGWNTYEKLSEELGKLRIKTQEAKEAVRADLMRTKNLSGNIDFSSDDAGDIRVIRILKEKGRGGTKKYL